VKAIISHPYSGALYWWFASQLAVGGSQASKAPDHDYYRHLYDDVDRHLDIALATTVVFDEIILPAADVAFPGTHKDGRHRAPEIGLSSDWDHFHHATDVVRSHEEELRQDSLIGQFMPSESWRHSLMVEYAAADIVLSAAHEAPVLCTPDRRAVITRLVELGLARDLLGTDGSPAAMLSADVNVGLSGYFTAVGLTFEDPSFDSITAMREDDRIRAYASGFQRRLVETSAPDADVRLVDLIADAIEAARALGQTAATFTAGGRALDIAGFIPGINIAASAGSIALDGAAEATSKRAEHHRWYEVGPEIRRHQELDGLAEWLRDQGAD
jgi:hypothetical protein